MWALVKNNSVVKIFKQPKAMTIDSIQYPKNIFTKNIDKIDMN